MNQDMDPKAVEKLAKALSDRNRLLILQKIAQQRCVGCCQVNEVVPLTQPAVSHHLKVLVEAGLVHSDKAGRNINLSLNMDKVQELINYLTQLKSKE
ncbi:metalloregulator ArsR/SmtB family transcription factor [Rhodocytophaga aerolata]|uniref:Metalloregulator ArsR/SmtB family transcription factor n=1 Tax=Rhodocytophaga aerolata TaxID=455078 RepID=A0ABT8R6X0_9BACT|nr:metalloregulator ArsR/SmtB family transcription factor [Rhodocytophaga aerolata]MDO1446440.1 metalloregulator ArsR/SmtB family transcription factor [Rhodocytophaga aerolata]